MDWTWNQWNHLNLQALKRNRKSWSTPNLFFQGLDWGFWRGSNELEQHCILLRRPFLDPRPQGEVFLGRFESGHYWYPPRMGWNSKETSKDHGNQQPPALVWVTLIYHRHWGNWVPKNSGRYKHKHCNPDMCPSWFALMIFDCKWAQSKCWWLLWQPKSKYGKKEPNPTCSSQWFVSSWSACTEHRWAKVWQGNLGVGPLFQKPSGNSPVVGSVILMKQETYFQVTDMLQAPAIRLSGEMMCN